MSKLGFQLYSARNYPPLSDVLSRLSKAGYAEVEGYSALYDHLDDNGVRALRADLDRLGLTMPTSHFPLEMLEAAPEKVLLIAKILGIETIYCPYIVPEERPTDARGWFSFGARLQAAGQVIRDSGLDFGWHNHDFEFVRFDDGSTVLDQIFAGGPDLSWEADIAWIIRGGGDPQHWIETYGHRISAVHVKDIAPAGENADEDGWADVGHGTVGWDRLIPVLRATLARHFVVEHDNPSDLDRVIGRSIVAFNSY